MTTQPELPDATPLPALRLAAAPQDDGTPDVDFDAFVRRYETRLRRLVARRIGDHGEAEEITQETLLRAYQHRATFASEDELMAWSTVVAQRLVIDRVRVRGRSIAVSEVPETARLGRDTADIVVARHEARAALESLEAIPTRQAAILWAREVEGLHYEDIAERFGITEPAVRSLLHRGRRALRKEFQARTGSVPLNGLVPFAPWLLALKAASKMRQAAKGTASNPFTASALGIAVVTMTLGQLMPVVLPPGGHRLPATTITAPTASAVAQQRPAATRAGLAGSTGDRQSPSDTSLPRSPGGDEGKAPLAAIPMVHWNQCVNQKLCTATKPPNKTATTIWIEALPSNPTGYGWVGVASEALMSECPDLPDMRKVRCSEDSEGRPPGDNEPTEIPGQPGNVTPNGGVK